MNDKESMGVEGQKRSRPRTVREHLDDQIDAARLRTLHACEAKAKAEFLGLLDAPMSDLEKIIYSH